ncbi:hypothetical protein RZS08_22855, partial [Arthrospira platensis SPKY1]|nr:hypothetical protein [Arthrospira platensis SPKY1]
MNASPVNARALFQSLESALDARWVAGRAGANRVLWPPLEVGTSLYGRLNWIQPSSLQLIGPEESAFLGRLEPVARDVLIRNLLDSPTGALLVCEVFAQAEALRVAADAAEVPLWYAPLAPAVVLEWLGTYRHSL